MLKDGASIVNILLGILSGPIAFLSLNDNIISVISFDEVGFKNIEF